MERFKYGLKLEIQAALAPIRYQTFEDLIDGAREFERAFMNLRVSRNQNEKRKMQEGSYEKHQ